MGLPYAEPFYTQNGTTEGLLSGVNYGAAHANILNPNSLGHQSLNHQLRQVLITDLPPASISKFLNFLYPKELGIVSCVSTTLHNIVSEHHVWKEFYCERWGLPIISDTGFSNEKSWKYLLRELRRKTFLGRYSIDVLHGHTEPIYTVCLLASAKLIFSAGCGSVIRTWDMEEGFSVSADTELLVAGVAVGFIHCWKDVEGLPHLFDLNGVEGKNEFRLWEHEGPVVAFALDLTRIYSGSFDMTVCVWDRSSLKCTQVLRHNDLVYGLDPHDMTVACASGEDVFLCETNTGTVLHVIRNAHFCDIQALARSRNGEHLFTAGQDGTIRMFQIITEFEELRAVHVATWCPYLFEELRVIHMFQIITEFEELRVVHVATWCSYMYAANSLAFECPLLLSNSINKLALIDVQKLLTARRHFLGENISNYEGFVLYDIDSPQRLLHGSEFSFLSIGQHWSRPNCMC